MKAGESTVINRVTQLDLEREKLLWCVVGSHNYNLNDKDSDKDFKIFVLPTFDDLYFGNQFSTETKVGDEFDYNAHDVRKLPYLWWKSNINFVEVLFSTDVRCNPRYVRYIELVFANKEKLASMNLPYLYSACLGMHFNKYKLLEKGTAGTQFLVDKFGYDTKQALHCYRVLDFLQRYKDNGFSDFRQAIWYSDSKRDFMLQIKHGAYSLEQFKEMVLQKRYETEILKTIYQEQPINNDVKQKLDDATKELVSCFIQGK